MRGASRDNQGGGRGGWKMLDKIDAATRSGAQALPETENGLKNKRETISLIVRVTSRQVTIN